METAKLGKILLVDDESTNIFFLGLALTDDGFDIRMATNGEDAIKEGLAFLPDVLVSDWRLNNSIDGIEVAKTLQKAVPNLKVLLFSGSSSEELTAHASEIDLFAALEKPLGIDDVTNFIRKAIKERNSL